MAYDKNSLLTQTAHVLLGSRDFPELAKKSTSLMIRELEQQHLVGVGLFRVHEREKELYAYAYATTLQRLVEKLLPNRKFAQLHISLDENDNLMVRTVISNQTQYGNKAADFSKGVLPPLLADKLQILIKGKFGVALPITNKNGKVAGAVLFALDQEQVSAQQLSLFQAFAQQLGLAFFNISEFERLASKYQKSVGQNSLSTLEKEKIPNVRFTLRLTTKESENLKRLAKARGKTQAEYIRDWLDSQ